jgi:hypothetical protein
LQNTVPIRHLGAAIGTMNFVRTLMGTILVAVFGAIVLNGVSLGAPADTLGQRVLAATSAATFATVFFAAAGALMIAFLAMVLLEEKPLEATVPDGRS